MQEYAVEVGGDGEGGVAGFGAGEQVHGAGDHGMIPTDEGQIFANEGTGPAEGGVKFLFFEREGLVVEGAALEVDVVMG